MVDSGPGASIDDVCAATSFQLIPSDIGLQKGCSRGVYRVVASWVARAAQEAAKPSHPCFEPAAADRTPIDRCPAVAAPERAARSDR